jgi:toll-interacting protein
LYRRIPLEFYVMLEEHNENTTTQESHATTNQSQAAQPPPPTAAPPPAVPAVPRMPVVGQVNVTLVQAKLSRSHSFGGFTRMDPYVRVRFGHNCFTSATALNADKCPRWNQTVVCPYAHGLNRIHIEILDEKTFGTDKVIASTEIQLPEIIFSGNTVDDWYPLDGELGEGTEGLMNVVLSYREVPAHMTNPYAQFLPGTATYIYSPSVGVPPPPAISEEDVNSLKELFPDYDVEVIRSVLVSKGGNKDAAADTLLAMSQ